MILQLKNITFRLCWGSQLKNTVWVKISAARIWGLCSTPFDYAYLNNVKTIVPGKTLVGGSPAGESAISSFFGRVNYNFKETYLASVILRTDGSSNFARGNRWGYFPSVSLGWVISNEAFMDNTKMWMDFLKIRAS